MTIKVVRAKQGLYVPVDPEVTNGRLQMIQTGMLTLVSSNYPLPENSYIDLGEVNLKKSKKKED